MREPELSSHVKKEARGENLSLFFRKNTHTMAETSAVRTATATEEEEVIRRRLLLKEAPLKRVAKRMLAFREAVATKSVAEAEAAHAALLRDLDSFEATLRHADVLYNTYVEERANLDALAAAQAAREAQVREELAALQERLSHERAALAHKEQCAALLTAVAQKPKVPELREEVARLECEIAELQRSVDATAARLDLRSKQFRLLLQVAALLGAELESQQQQQQTTSASLPTTGSRTPTSADVPMPQQ